MSDDESVHEEESREVVPDGLERALTYGESRPLDLDSYVDWSMDKACQGRVGRYQQMVLCMLASFWTCTSMQTYFLEFVAKPPDIDNPSGRVLRLDGNETCSAAQVAVYGPSCPELNRSMCGPDGRYNKTLYRDLWTYRDPEYSVMADFDESRCSLEGSKFITLVQSMFWWVHGIGVSVAGCVSDKKGRRFAWYMYLTIMVIGSGLLAVSPNQMFFAAARLISAFGIGGFSMIGFVWSAESLNSESQHYMAWVPNAWFCVGACVPAVVTWVTRDWRSSIWIYTVFCLPWYFVSMPFYESPKWLAAHKKGRKTLQAMSGIAKTNGFMLTKKGLPPCLANLQEQAERVTHTSSESSDNPDEEETIEEVDTDDTDSSVVKERKENLWSLFHPAVLQRLIVSSMLWFVVSYGYYGLSLFKPPMLFGDHEVYSWCFSFFLEIPAYLVSAYMMKHRKFGRKITSAGATVFGGLILLVVSQKTHLPEDMEWLVGTVLYFPARMSIAMGFAVVYCWSAELFPSSVRSSAMGVNSFAARVGTSLAPWVGLVEYFPHRMFLIAVPTTLVGILALFTLPETIGRPLPGTIRDLEGD